MASYLPGSSPARNSQQAASPFRIGSNLTRYMQQKPPMYANAGVQGGPVKLGVAPTPNPGPSVNVSPGYSPEPHLVERPHAGPLAPVAQTSAAPVSLAPGSSSASTPGPQKPGPSPLDSTYFANVNTHNFGVGQQINALSQQAGYNTTDYNQALGNLAYQQPRDELQTEEAAGRRGGVYSTVLDQQLGDLAHNYLMKSTGLTNAYTRKQGTIASEGNALWAGIPIYASGQAVAAGVRAANANAKNPALGESTKPLTPVQQTATRRLATALAAAHKTGKTQRTLTQGRTIISRPNGTQQATHTAGGMFGGTVTRTPAQTAALRALLGGK